MRPAARLAVVLALLALALAPATHARADTVTHVVQPGETLFRISLNYGIPVDALRAANGIYGNIIYVGQMLVIPLGGDAQPAANTAPAPAPTASGGTHVVQPGENLFRIGLKYGLTVTAMQAANGLSGTLIYVGQTLVIPGAGSTASSPAAPAPAPKIAAPPPPAAGSGAKRFLIDLSEQRLYAYEGDTMVRTTLVSTGLPGTPTVTGTFYIYLRYSSQRMVGPGYDLPGVPYVQYFYQSYGLHGTYWHNNFGQPMSHGCVNMPTPESEWAYSWATYGTPVIVQH